MDKLVEVYMGYEHSVRIVQMRLLDEAGIPSMIENEFASGAIAGFGGGTLSSVRLYVKEVDAERVLSLLEAWK